MGLLLLPRPRACIKNLPWISDNMAFNTVVSDWNGTIFGYPTAEPENRELAHAALAGAKKGVLSGRVWEAWDIVRLLMAKRGVERRLEEYKHGECRLIDVYEPFNEYVIRGMEPEFVNGVIDGFARRNASRVDERVLRPIKTVHDEGARTGILSVSYERTIKEVLKGAGYNEVFNEIAANRLLTENGKAAGFTLDIYGIKGIVFQRRFLGENLRGQGVAYLGDTEDDEPVAEILPRGGFIVPFMAKPEFRERMTKTYGAFAPRDEPDLLNYLKRF